jgi:peptidoglycan L-alanyl-D-glutamate endopeptidase CwlK
LNLAVTAYRKTYTGGNMTERSRKMIGLLKPEARRRFTAMCETLDRNLGDDAYIIFEGLRTEKTQSAYFAQGRAPLEEVNKARKAAGLYLLTSEKQNYTITWTMKSRHLEGLAMDILPARPDGEPTWDLAHYRRQFEIIRNAGREAGLECGADWPEAQRDWPHYEVKEG